MKSLRDMSLEVSLTDFLEAGEPIEYSTQTTIGRSPVVGEPCGSSAAKNFLNAFSHIGRALHDLDSCGHEGRHLLRRGAFSTCDDRSGVAHASSGRRRLARDKRDDGLLEVLFDP